MTGPGGPARPGRADERPGSPPGLLAALMAAVRPEFRGDVLVFAPDDPVFGGPQCRVTGCRRTARMAGMCSAHYDRWAAAGRPDAGQFAVSAGEPWHGYAPPAACAVAGCGFAVDWWGLCHRHAWAWRTAGRPEADGWARAQPPVIMAPGQASCQVGFCQMWAHPGVVLCYRHHHRWKLNGRPDLTAFISALEAGPAGREQVNLTALPRQLRLEVQYALQRRSDEKTSKTKAAIITGAVRWLAGSGADTLMDRSEQAWRDSYPPRGAHDRRLAAFVIDAHRKVTALAEGEGWDNEYPRDLWRLRRLGIRVSHTATLQFGGISQPWLKEPVKRWTRWRLCAGMDAGSCYKGVQALTRFSVFLQAEGITGTEQIDRGVLERYLADLHRALAGRVIHRKQIGQLSIFLRDIRHHQQDTSLPPDVMIYPEDYPRREQELPRALAEHVMAQIEDSASLARWGNPAYQLITMILIRCGLRISDAAGLPFNCLARDPSGAPYLRYHNQKMKREALVPVDEELEQLIIAQQHRVLDRWAAPPAVLFPRIAANPGGNRPVPPGTYRDNLHRWLARCDIRDEHGQPARLTPHQWRHTLGTRLINRDVPQHVVQKILDHDSPLMTAHYARLSDQTVRQHWEKARKVGASGQAVQVSPEGPLGEAAWAKQRLSRATQALPNGYCQLPMVKTCPHANACLTCPMFLTTAEFLPRHHSQHRATLQLITAAEANGQGRLAEMNKQVAANLEKIITALETDGDQDKAAVDAS